MGIPKLKQMKAKYPSLFKYYLYENNIL